jgi:hypothetical protein
MFASISPIYGSVGIMHPFKWELANQDDGLSLKIDKDFGCGDNYES